MNRYIFTIRDVLWLTVVVGLALALWNEHRSAKRWRWAAQGRAGYIKTQESGEVKFKAKSITINWPN